MRAFSGRVGWDIRMLWSAFFKLLKPARLWCRLGCVWKALEWSLPLQSTRQCAEQSFLMVSSACQIKTKYGNITNLLRWSFFKIKIWILPIFELGCLRLTLALAKVSKMSACPHWGEMYKRSGHCFKWNTFAARWTGVNPSIFSSVGLT